MLLATLSGCTRTPKALAIFGETMGTTYSVKIVPEGGGAIDGPRLEKLRRLVEDRLEEVNAKMSTYSPQSELSRFNAWPETSPFTVSRETLEVLTIAAKVSGETGGAFDITVGPLVNAWGFGPSFRSETPPDAATIAALQKRIGYRLLELSAADSTVRKSHPDVYCDLSAVAKGYAVDRVADALEAQGVERYMVEVGGEVRTRGRNDRGEPWQIAIERPDPTARSIERIVPVSDLSVATSGDYRNFFEREGRLYSHIMDARTGRPVAHALASVSVFHARCAVADAYATAILVLGPEEGYRFAVEKDLAVLFIVRDPAGGFAEKATPGFERLLGPR
jgi:thiamine biosynthesis lipoprotein